MPTIGQSTIQEQNKKAEARMRAVAEKFKSEPASFQWLTHILESQSEFPKQGVLVSFNRTPDKEGTLCEGMWLSADERFFEFSVVLPDDNEPPEIEYWNDVSDDTIVNAHQPGTGKSFGFLAMEILNESLKA